MARPVKTSLSPTNGHAADASPPAASTPPRTPPLVPPHVAWPLFVVLLLLMSVGAAVVTVLAAHSDGGVQIVEDSPYDPGRHGAD